MIMLVVWLKLIFFVQKPICVQEIQKLLLMT